MKKLLFLTAVLSFLIIGGLNAQATTASPQNRTISVKVDGLSCPFCAYGLEKKFKKLEGVENIKIDIKKGMLSFTVQEGKTVSEKQIRKKVKEAGFTPKEITYPTESSPIQEEEKSHP